MWFNHPRDKEDVERLDQKSHKVFQSLHYVQDAVDKGILELLPGSITIVLETVMELNQLLGNYFIDQDSTVMMSMNKHMYQSLAHLIRWADDLLLHNKSDLDKVAATEVIKAVTDGIQDLVRLSTDKLQKRDSKPANIKTSVPETPHRSSLPDIPLTPREKEILKETSVFPANNISKSSEDIVDNGDMTFTNSDEPPPKPPRPEHLQSLLASARLQEDPGVPPPLPAKQRSANVFVFDTNSHSDLSGQSTPTNVSSPHHSALVATSTSADTAPSDGLQISTNHRSVTKTTMDSRYSQYDNFNAVSLRGGGAGIHDLTARIEKLTSDIDLHGRSSTGVDVTDLALSPPPLPTKRTSRNQEKGMVPRSRVTSAYDNMDDAVGTATHSVARTTQSSPALANSRHVTSATSGVMTSASTGVMRSSRSLTSPGFRTVLLSSSCTTTMQVTVSKETFSSTETFSSMGTEMFGSSAESLQKPPPLPLKKRHVEAYMQMLGHYMGPGSAQEFSRHSVHSVNFYHSQWQRHQMELFQPFHATRSNTISVLSDFSNHSSDKYSTTSGSSSDDSQLALLSWKPLRLTGLSMLSAVEADPSSRVSLYDNTGHLETSDNNQNEDRPPISVGPMTAITPRQSLLSDGSPSQSDLQNDSDSDFSEMSTLDDIDVSDQLVRKQQGEDGPELRGGTIDALIVHATTAGKHDFMFQEAFLTTYRTFITPRLLLQKLLYRYNRFSRINDPIKKKLSRNAFSFVIRMLDELCTELDEGILRTVMDLVFQLLCDGELMLARILRNKVLEKCECRRHLQQAIHNVILLPSYQLTMKTHRLMDFKSEQVAEQMTLLDADLFHKIDIPEVLLWSKEQSEEYSPNLAKFTEHFNKMSYWWFDQVPGTLVQRTLTGDVVRLSKAHSYDADDASPIWFIL
ncbi:Rap guanine nucleotide exchange factor 1 [Lamellibrachia satsuma]|nr:Rap guanine nucleotide exchange factor 1 [Lamellibrachia satsuma]